MKIFLLLCPIFVFALPQSPQVISGDVSYISHSEQMEITASDRSIIEWAEFHIGENELTRFIQPDRQSTVFNHVLDAAPSRLFGRLESNGQVILMNPNGILVGKNASIHTGSLIASTLEINRELFLEMGALSFVDGSGGMILNEGMIKSDEVLMIGQLVENQGLIRGQKIYIRTSTPDSENPFAGAFLRCGGELSGKEIDLFGGSIHIQGKILADGIGGGGAIRVEGDMIYMEPHALISASAIESGSGGSVVLLGQEMAFLGTVFAKGATGNGGFAEISGVHSLIFEGHYDGSSLNGMKGELLLDPNDITISGGATSGGVFPVMGTCFDGTTPLGSCQPLIAGFQPANLNVTELNNALANNNVTVQTNPTTVGGLGDITLVSGSAISWSADTSLTLQAQRNLNIQGDIGANTAFTGTGSQIVLNAGGDLSIGFAGQVGTLSVFTVDGGISLSGANITVSDPTGNSVQVEAQGAGGAMVISTPGALIVQSPGVGFPGVTNVLGIQSLTLHAASCSISGGGDTNNLTDFETGGAMVATVTGLTQISGGAGTMSTATVASNGSMTFSTGSLTMLAGTSPVGNCEAILESGTNQTINVANLLQMIGGTTPIQDTAGCRINAQLNQTVNAGQIIMRAGDQTNVTAEITSLADQVINCAGNLFMSGTVNLNTDLCLIGYGTSQLINAGSITMIGATNLNTVGVGGPQIINVAGDFFQDGFTLTPPASSLVSSGNFSQTVTIGGNLTVEGNNGSSGSSWGSGDNSLMSVRGTWRMLGNGIGGGANYTTGSNSRVIVDGDLIIDSTAGDFSGILGQGNFDVRIGNDLLIGNPLSNGAQILSIGDHGNIIVGSNLLNICGAGTTSVSQVLTVSNATISVANDYIIQAGSGMFARGGLNQFFSSPTGLVSVVVGNDFTVTGGAGEQAYGFIANFLGLEIRAGRDFGITGGSGHSGEAFLYSFGINGIGPDAISPASVNIQAGRDLFVSGGNAPLGAAFGYIEGMNSSLVLAAGRNVNLTGGSNAADNHAMIGSAWIDFTSVGAPNLADTFVVQISAFGDFTAQNGPDGSIAYLDFVAAGPGLIEPFDRGSFTPNNNGSLLIFTGGDLTVSSGFNASEAPAPSNFTIHPIVTIADHAFAKGEAWSGTSNAFLSSTPLFSASPAQPSNARGGFKVDTGVIGGSVAFTSILGEIHVSSAELFNSGAFDNLIIGSGLNNLTLTSVSGNITVDPFHNITITNGVTTGGNVLMIAQNNISMTDTGFITAGGSVDLVVDNQAPRKPLIGPGAFLMNASASITSGGSLRIFTARQSHNSIFGLLNGTSFSAGPLYTNTATEQWCVYFPDPILGVPFTIFYKDCQGQVTNQANVIISEMLADLHPPDENLGWREEFTLYANWGNIFDGAYLFEPYYLRRRHLQLINHPKSWTEFFESQ